MTLLLHRLIRQLAMFGDYFFRPDIVAKEGITFVEPIEPFEIEPVYLRRRLRGYKTGDSKLAPPWSFIHARLPGRDINSGMGDSFLWNMRILFRQIKMSEDAVLFYRLTRAATRWEEIINEIYNSILFTQLIYRCNGNTRQAGLGC